jgi:RimJ/RimL family protein N-acetyltransferase
MVSNNRFLREIWNAILVLLITFIVSVVIGLFLNAESLGNWGSWLGAFIAGIALVASSYAIVIQARQGESSSWNIALGRLGELYDSAQNEPHLARILTEPTDPDGKILCSSIDKPPSHTELVWLCSLFLAYEQIYVATLALSSESQRVWRLYLKNQLNKPYIRTAFTRDAMNAKDYHNEFWRFVRGIPCERSLNGYRDYSIPPMFFDSQESIALSSNNGVPIYSEKFLNAHAGFWLDLYKDEVVRHQMYAAPTSCEDELIKYLSARVVYTVFQDQKAIGGFTLTPEKDRIATFGIVLHPTARGKKISHLIMQEIESKAKELGMLTLRGDVYSDNVPCIKALEKNGFRKFIWFEKNIN